ncbi:hypothetical protein LZD49_26460 [Dyadobacter sp. CY261]|uniref:hypothetical protein n=1 Tax=Dyadobacter sp. CY261 TaxID=2907203 RepID=UPI001F35C758|nr:hypothetical protein [Dyadobacter sp. CY261]MCF0074053.1 hypothetical protein [Dyadobacter sp. CY261]
MKTYCAAALMLCVHGAIAQNQISAPVGQSLKVVADSTVVSGNLKVSNQVFFSNYRLLNVKKTAAGDLNTVVGPNAGNLTMTGRWNTLLGENAGLALTTGANNTFLGTYSGSATTTGIANTFIGYKSGFNNVGGNYNVLIGNTAGLSNTSGTSNVIVGLDGGYSNTTGGSNVYIGRGAGYTSSTGSNNTMVGTSAGNANSGSGNVFIGSRAGQNETTANDKLIIANSNVNLPLVTGEFPLSTTTGGKLVINGQVGIGVTTFPTTAGSINVSGYQLFVNGGALAKQVVVSNSWADYVFEKSYQLKPLEEVEDFIKTNGHLPNIPSAREVETKGLDLGDMARRQQEKIEELTLYTIQHDKLIRKNEELIRLQEEKLKQIEGKLSSAGRLER